MTPTLSRLFCIGILLTLAACSSARIRLYDGAPRPPEQVAVVSMPEALEVARVNGVEVKGASGMLHGGDKVLELAPGRYELLIFYREVWEQAGEHDVLRSDPALFVIDAQAGHHYRVAYAEPKRYDRAQALAADFSGWVEDQADGSKSTSQPSGLKFRSGVLAAVSSSNELVADTSAGGQTQVAVAPLPVPVASASADRSEPNKPAATAALPDKDAAKASDWSGLMRAWWKQATPEERREFLRWVAEQP